MVTKDEVIELVGRERYAAEAAVALIDAARSDYGRGFGAELDVPHDVQEHIWWEAGSWQAKIALMFAIFDDMPAYGHLMYASHHYNEFDTDARAFWWHEVIARIASGDPARSQPLSYALWCDFFEDPDSVAEAWTVMTAPNVPASVLRAALRASGPVPYEMKRPVYDRLLADPAWHEAIFESLLFSTHDYFGKIDASDAQVILARLVLSPDLRSDVDALRVKLA